jgi:hypothetical protein
MDERSANGPSIVRCNRYAIIDDRVAFVGAVRSRWTGTGGDAHRGAARRQRRRLAGSVDVDSLPAGFINPHDR